MKIILKNFRNFRKYILFKLICCAMKDATKHYLACKLIILTNSKQNHNFIKNAIDKIKTN